MHLVYGCWKRAALQTTGRCTCHRMLLAARNRAGFGFAAAMALVVAVIAPAEAAETTERINFAHFLDGTRIPKEALIRDQFEKRGGSVRGGFACRQLLCRMRSHCVALIQRHSNLENET
jgi:hypothetical protein